MSESQSPCDFFCGLLGLSMPQMNRDHDYGYVVENQLSVLERLGMFQNQEWANEARNRLRDDLKKTGLDDKAVADKIAGMTASQNQRGTVRSNLLPLANDKYARLANPYDKAAKREARAKSYLHSNCAICHIEAGGGNAPMQLEFATTLDKMKIIDAVPRHDKFGLPDARIVAPGHPERSVLLHRVAMRGRGQMPQLATTLVDKAVVEMLTEWIKQMPGGQPSKS